MDTHITEKINRERGASLNKNKIHNKNILKIKNKNINRRN